MESFKKRYEDLTIADDFMFGKVMRTNPELCRKLLEMILNKPIRKIVFRETQKCIDIIYDKKGIRIDVYVEDEANTIYTIEMQTTNARNLPKRCRYYHALTDLDVLEKGKTYNELPTSYVIFLCTFDPIGDGDYIYTYENRRINKLEQKLNDGNMTVFVNACGKSGDISQELADFLKYMTGRMPKDGFAKQVYDAVEHAILSREWRAEFMTLEALLYDERAEGIEEGIRRRNWQLVKELLVEKMPDDLILRLSKVTPEELLMIKKEVERDSRH